MYLLDTDTIIFALKGDTAVQKNLRNHARDPMKISVVTLMELYYGAHKSRKLASNLGKVKTLENAFEIIPVGQAIAEVFGVLKAGLEKAGSPVDAFDLIIAACALGHNLMLVANNVRHFKRIDGLKLTNWTRYPEDAG
jgi:predicted nucleic acid-binding protein